MRLLGRGIGVPAVAALLVLIAGCTGNRNFVYKPNLPVAGAQKVPVKVVVFPFADGTEDFTKRGSALGTGEYNLAKTGISGSMVALPPEFWGKSFAEDLAASGSFRSVRFVYGPSEIRPDETIRVDGTLKKVVFAANWNYPHTILVSFKAAKASDGKIVWEKEIGRVWEQSKAIYGGCGTGLGCEVDKVHADWNRQMDALFAEARTDLVEKLTSLDAPAAGSRDAGTKKPESPSGESAEQTIDRILKGK